MELWKRLSNRSAQYIGISDVVFTGMPEDDDEIDWLCQSLSNEQINEVKDSR